MIEELGTNKFRFKSLKTGRNLGTYGSRAGAEFREKQVNFFKNKEKYQEDHPGEAFPPKRRSPANYTRGGI